MCAYYFHFPSFIAENKQAIFKLQLIWVSERHPRQLDILQKGHLLENYRF